MNGAEQDTMDALVRMSAHVQLSYDMQTACGRGARLIREMDDRLSVAEANLLAAVNRADTIRADTVKAIAASDEERAAAVAAAGEPDYWSDLVQIVTSQPDFDDENAESAVDILEYVVARLGGSR